MCVQLARSCTGHSLPAPHSSLWDRAGVNGFIHRAGARRTPDRPPVPSQAWACHRLFGYQLCMFLGRAGWCLDTQKGGLPLVTFSLLPDRVATAKGPGGARFP